MDFRTAGLNDASQIARLHAESWRNTYAEWYDAEYLATKVDQERLDFWTGFFTEADPAKTVIAAEEDDTIQGFISVFGKNDPKWGTFISNLHVSPEMKGRGIGKRLVQRGAEWANEHFPVIGMYLWVIKGNDGAIGFYEYIGGTRQEEFIGNSPDGGAIPEYTYTWESPQVLLNCVTA